MRKTEAYWLEKYNRWQINVYRYGERRAFYSSVPGKVGKHEAEAKADKWLKTFETSQKVHDALDMWLEDKAQKVGETTQYSVAGMANKWLRKLPNRPLASLSVYELQKLLDETATTCAKSTVAHIASLITEWLKYCRLRRWETPDVREGDLVVTGKATRARRAANSDELDALMRADPEADGWYAYAFKLAVLTGLRKGELLGLQWQDVDFAKSQITVARAINKFNDVTSGKTANALRVIPLQHAAVETLNDQKRMLQGAGIHGLIVFPTDLGLQTKTANFDYAWTKFANTHNIAITLHELRHTFISICKSEMPEALLKQVVGHSVQMDTYKTYGHAVDGDNQKIIDFMDDSFGKTR